MKKKGGYLMQRTILSQWFLFLVPDLKILRLHIVSLLCVSGALVDLEFPFFPFFLSLSRCLSLSLQPPILFFSFFLLLFFSVDQSFSLIRCFWRVTHANSLFFSLLFTANLDWNISF